MYRSRQAGPSVNSLLESVRAEESAVDSISMGGMKVRQRSFRPNILAKLTPSGAFLNRFDEELYKYSMHEEKASSA